MRAFAEWLAGTGPSVAIQSTFWFIRLLQATHLLAAGVVTGTSVLIALRVLGWQRADQPFEVVWRRLIEPNDGHPTPDWKTLKARFAADSEEEKKALAQHVQDNHAMIAALEEQLQEHAALLGLTNKMTRDVERAAEQGEELKRLLEAYKARNRKLREELGLRRGAPVEAPKRP